MVESMQVREISALRTDIDERKCRSTVLESPEGREKYLGFVNGLQLIGFPYSCHSGYMVLAPSSAGLTPAEHASFIGRTMS